MTLHANSPQASLFHHRHEARRAATISGCVFLFLAWLLLSPSFASAAAVVEFSTATASDAENSGGNLPVLLVDGTLAEDRTVEVAVTGGTATSGTDYTNTVTVTIPAGGGYDGTLGTAVATNLSITGDSVVEADETIELQLQNPLGDLSLGDANGAGGTQSTHTYTINDDDSAEASIAASTPAASEPGTNGQFTVTLSNQSASPTVVNYSVGGTASPGTDYTALSGQVTIPAGATSATLDVTVQDDAVLEPDGETVIVTLTSIDSGDTDITVGATDTATVTIDDNDSATVSITANDAAAAEPGDHGQFTVTLSNESASPTVVNYSVGGTATPGTDYTALSGQVTIPAGATSATLDVTVQNDAVLEPDGETVEVTLTGINSGDTDITVGATDTATVTIDDDDSATVSIAASISPASEPGTNGEFTVTLSNESSSPTVVNYSVGGTATPGPDYTALSGQVTIPAGNTSATLDVTVQDDIVLEPDGETVEVTLTGIDSGDGNISVGTPAVATVTIDDDDTALLRIAASTPAASEPGTDGQFTVSIDNPSSTDTVVNLSLGPSTATVGDDYASFGYQVTIPAGDYTTIVDVDVQDDSIVEPTENVTLDLSSIDSGDGNITIDGANDSATVNIADDDSATVSITANDATAAEPGDDGQFTVTLTNPSSTPTEVTYSVAGSASDVTDYTPLISPVTIPAGATSAAIDVAVLDDTEVEADGETVEVTLTGFGAADSDIDLDPDPADITATVTIDDDDAAALTISDESQAEGVTPMTFTITLDHPLDIAVVVDVTFADNTATGGGTDYDSTAQQVTFAAGDTTRTVDVPITNDAVVEQDEDFTVSLSTATALGDRPVDLSDTGTGTITNDDTATLTVTNTISFAEGAVLDLSVDLDNAVQDGFTVAFTVADGTATDADDFNVNTTSPLTFNGAAGESKLISILATGDAKVEEDEDFTVTLGTVTPVSADAGSITSGGICTATITDDDSATASITANDASAAEPVNDGQFTLTLSNPSSTDTVVNLDLAGSTATSPSDYTALPAAVTIPAGDTTLPVDVEVFDDVIVEQDGETVIVTLAGFGAHDSDITLAPNPADTATVTIDDDDMATFTINDVTVDEADGTLQFTVSLSNPVDIPVTVDVDYTDGTAIGGGVDYDSSTGTANFPADNNTDQPVNVPIVNDAIVEGNETFTADLTVTTAMGSRSYDDSDSGTGTITDNDYNLTMLVNPAGSGCTIVNTPTGTDCGPACDSYNYNRNVTLTPDPESGFAFSHWSGALSGVSYPQTVIMNADKTVTAHFETTEDCTPVMNQKTDGTTSWHSLGQYGFSGAASEEVNMTHEGDGSISFDAIRFVRLSDHAETIVDDGDPAATYAPSSGWTTIACADCQGGNQHETDAAGDKVTIDVGGLGLAGTYDVQVKWKAASDRDETAHYCVIGYGQASGGHPITATKGGNGTMSYTVNGGASHDLDTGTSRFWVSTGDDVTFTFEADGPDPQYEIEYVAVDGDILDAYTAETGAQTYTFPSVAAAHDIEVSFTQEEEGTTETCYSVNQTQDGSSWYYLGSFNFWSGTRGDVVLSHQGDGSISLDAVKWVPEAGGAEIVIDDDDVECLYDESGSSDWAIQDCADCFGGYHHYSDTEGDQVTITPDLPEAGVYSIYVQWHETELRDTTASFCVHGHQGQVILAEAGPNGVMVTDSGVTVESGATKVFTVISGSGVTFTAHPDTGYEVNELIVDGESLSGATFYWFSNILSSHTITALFQDHGFDCSSGTPISCGSGVSGMVSPVGDVDYFEVDLGGSGRYTFYTTGDTDTLGTLLDPFCTPITSDDESGGDSNFAILANLDAGTYYVSVESASGTTGEYSMHMTCEHVVRSSAGAGGRIDPAGNVIVPHNSGTTFAITPDSGVTIIDVVVDGTSVGPVSTYGFSNVTKNHTIEALFSFEPTTCTDISDVPLDALTSGVGAIVMFVLDDSGSMDWEFMTGEGDGLFMNEDYVFDNPGDNLYWDGYILSGDDRGRWKSQWQGYNHIYYNPQTTYETWPTLPNADPDDPQSHPYHATPTFNMDTTYYSVMEGYVVNNDGVYDGTYVNDDGTGSEFTCTKDAWNRSSGSNWYGNDTTRSMFANQWDSGATASWCPNLPSSGEYEVYVWYTNSGTRDADVPYQVVYDGGAEYGILGSGYTVNQRNDAGSWVKLYKTSDGSDTWQFNAADAAAGLSGVTLTRWNGTDQWDVPADTVPAGDGAGGNEPNLPSDNWNDAHGTSTCADAVAFVPVTGGTIDIPRSHYYTLYDLDGDEEVDPDETVYLVCLNGSTSSIDYYEVNVSDDHIGSGDLTAVAEADVPDVVRPRNPDGSFRTYAQERQNFANWYSFYRRRELTAIAAISRTIYDLEGVYVGFTSINGKIDQEALPINIDGEDRRSDLLSVLYEYVGSAYGTPLRRGFEDAGEYLDQEDGSDGGLSSDSPWKAQGDGGECQQAFAIVMTDGYYNGGSPYVGNVDGDNGDPYADTYSETLADVAMKYYERDLVSSLEDMVPTNAFDAAEYQHMVTYTVSFGVSGTLDPEEYDLSAGSTNYPTWPYPYSSSQAKIDDMWHAAVNGRGQYLNAGDPDELVSSLQAIMQNIAARTGSAASVSINGDQLFGILGDDVRIFQARYSSGTMTGDVLSFELDQDTGEVLIDTPVWSAADELDDRVDTNGHEDRIIATYSLASGVGGIPFRFSNIDASGTTMQVEYLTPDWSASAAASPENLVHYLRGEQTNEVKNLGPFRDRSSRLGDIVNSSPTYFDGMLYAGGNDGMLHAFDAETGREVFAYVPGLVYDHLKDYADPDYSHLFYVDQTPYVAEGVEISGDEKSVLLGGLGKGGKGYYALDISGVSGTQSFVGKTESDLADRVLWEYPDADTPAGEVADMGYSFSRAYVYGSNDPTYPWIVVFGNGYNSENSSAVLFIVDPETGDLIHRIDTGEASCNGLSSPALFDADFDGAVDYIYAGDLRGNLWKFDLTSSSYEEWGVAYGTDNAGFTAINADEGDDPAPVFQARGPAGSLQPITVEPDFMYHCDPSMPGMMVVFGTGKYLGEDDISDTSVQSVYGIWDYGDDEADDEYLGEFQRGFVPQLSNQPGTVTLLEQIAVDYVRDIEVDTDGDGTPDTTEEMKIRVLSGNTPYWEVTTTPDGTNCGDYPGSEDPCDPDCFPGCSYAPDLLAHAGWYVDLPNSGERVIGNPIIRLGVLNYVSFTPEDSPCGGEGNSFPNFADPCDGGNLGEAFIDINQDGIINEEDLINLGTETEPVWVAPSARQFEGRLQPPAIVRMPGAYGESRDRYFFSSSLGTVVGQTTKSPKMGIIYWKDLLN